MWFTSDERLPAYRLPTPAQNQPLWYLLAYEIALEARESARPRSCDTSSACARRSCPGVSATLTTMAEVLKGAHKQLALPS